MAMFYAPEIFRFFYARNRRAEADRRHFPRRGKCDKINKFGHKAQVIFYLNACSPFRSQFFIHPLKIPFIPSNQPFIGSTYLFHPLLRIFSA
jgi:hypothetical protein